MTTYSHEGRLLHTIVCGLFADVGALLGFGLFRLKQVVYPKRAPVFVKGRLKTLCAWYGVYRLNNTVAPVLKFLFLIIDAKREQ